MSDTRIPFSNTAERERWLVMYERALAREFKPNDARLYADADMVVMRTVKPAPVVFDLPELLDIAAELADSVITLETYRMNRIKEECPTSRFDGEVDRLRSVRELLDSIRAQQGKVEP
jgi:hypothetical protein